MTFKEGIEKVKAFLSDHKRAIGYAAIAFMAQAGWCLAIPHIWWVAVIALLAIFGGISVYRRCRKDVAWNDLAIDATGAVIGMIIALVLFLVGVLA